MSAVYPAARDVPSLDLIERAVRERFGTSALTCMSLRVGTIEPRWIAMWLAREMTGLPDAAIAAWWTNREAATVRHAISVVDSRLDIDPGLVAVAGELMMAITALMPVGGSIIEARREPARAAPAAYSCPRCGNRSWHPVDLDERYCGACHRFGDDQAAVDGQ